MQNLSDNPSSLIYVSLVRYGLMKNCCRDIVAHNHTCRGNQVIASNTIEHGIPLASTTHQKDSSHLFLTWRTKGMMPIDPNVIFVAATYVPLFRCDLTRG